MTSPIVPTEIGTAHLTLRRPRVEDAHVQSELWSERDPKAPPHRRRGPDGRPTVEDLADALRAEQDRPTNGLLTVVRKDGGDVIGYCGLLFDGRGPSGEPELAYELLRRVHGFGYATEAAAGVLEWAAEAGYPAVRAGVRKWNTASLRVLDKLGFVDTGHDELDAEYGDSVVAVRTFP